MQATRKARVESLLREELSVVIPRMVKDPRVAPLTITHVEMTPDGKVAKIFFSLLGRAEDDSSDLFKGCLAGLTSARGFLRSYLAKAVSLRHVPDLRFQHDRGLENSMRVHELLQNIDERKGTHE